MPNPHDGFSNLRVFEHPLIQQKLTMARDARTNHQNFRRLLNEIAGLMTYEVSRTLPTRAVPITTPMEPMTGVTVAVPVTLVPILRAGIGMTDGVLALMPEARVGHIGIFRDEATRQPITYYVKLPPDIAQGVVYLVDPMLATGGTASCAATMLRSLGCADIRMICLVAAPEGVARMLQEHPQVTIFTAALDRELNALGYILPGLGDAGDRIFGTL
jgi:uracil phosphoribosyltransferase